MQEGIQLGEIISNEDDSLISFLNRWTQLVDKLILEDIQEKGYVTEGQLELEKLRFFSYNEYIELFNDSIPVEEYTHYPVYYALGIDRPERKGGFRLHYTMTKADYIRVVRKYLPYKLRKFIDRKNKSLRFVLPYTGKTKHRLVLGGTGSGKSTLLHHIFYYTDQYYPRVTQIFIDPHGTLSRDLLKTKTRKDVVHFSIDKKKDYTFVMNLMEQQGTDERAKRFASSNIVSVLEEVLTTNFTDVQGNLLQKTVDFLLDRSNSTLQDFIDLLRLEPAILQEAETYNQWFKDQYQSGRINNTREAVLNRFEYVFESRSAKDVLLGESTFNLRALIDQQKTIIFDLSGFPEGKTQTGFGKLLLAYIKNVLFHRGALDDPMPVFLYIDEAQLFVTSAYEVFLSQMRKFSASITLAYQYIKQLEDDRIREAIKQNTDIKILRPRYDQEIEKIGNVPSGIKNGSITMKNYEFVADIFNREPVIFKAPFYLWKDKYQLSEPQQLENSETCIQQYYKNVVHRDITPIKKELKPLVVPLRRDDVGKFTMPPLSMSKYNSVLYFIAYFKFLTLDQMIEIGIANSQTNIPTGALKKDGYIKSVKVQKDHLNDVSVNAYYLTKKGAKLAETLDVPVINYPRRTITSVGNWLHKKGITDACIQLFKHNCIVLRKDIDSTGKANVRATRILFEKQFIEPDAIAVLNNNGSEQHYLIEYERLADKAKAIAKLKLHIDLMESQAYNRMVNFSEEYRLLLIVEEPNIYNNLIVDLYPKYRERVLVKMWDADFYNGWVNLAGEKMLLY